tara:strand:- start:5821 stop:6264 length:444 start_codon:yes stop_codon:yes gene_type:complete
MTRAIKAVFLLFGVLVVSRLLPLPANSEPLLGLAVLTPYLSKHNLAFLLTPAVMLVSDLVLGFGNWIWFTYPALAIASLISEKMSNKYVSLLYGWLVWHVMANWTGTFPPFTPEALLFDLRFLASGLSVVVLYDLSRSLWQTAYREV